MNLTEAVNKLGVLMANFNKENAEPIVTTEQKFVDAKLNDGVTIISYDAEELATGVIVYILDEAGQRLPLPVGDYVLEDGTTFTVVDDLGTIDNVVLAEVEEVEDKVPAAAPSTEAPMATAPAAPTAAPKRVIKSQVEEHVFSLEIEGVEPISVDFSSMFKKLEDENVKLKELNKQMFSVIEKMSELPASAPTETKQKFNAAKSKQDYLASMAELADKLSKENTY